MALKIWLPLNGNLTNNGVNNYTITKDNNVTFDTGGKLGKYAASTSSSAKITINVPELATMFGAGHKYSVACWVKLVGTVTSGWVVKIGNTNTGLWWAKSEARWVWNEADNGKRCYRNEIASDYTNWYHVVTVVDKTESGKIKYWNYVDGAIDTQFPSQNFATPSTVPSGTNILIYPNTASICDLRIYDHCLSEKEIKEISKCLIAHYPLDIVNLQATKNYLAESVSRPDLVDYTITHASSTNKYINIGTINVDHNGFYTFSAYIENNSNANIYFAIRGYKVGDTWGSYVSGTGTTIAAGNSGYASVTINISDAATYTGTAVYVRMIFNKARNAITGNIKTKEWILEDTNERKSWILGQTYRACQTVYDTSGYFNNGIVSGQLTLNQPSPRYKYYTKFDGTTAINIGQVGKLPSNFTFSVWVRCDVLQGRIWSSIQAGGTGIDPSSGWRARAYINGAYKNLTSYNPNALWHFYCMTYDGANLRYYVDGAQHASQAQTLPVTYHATNATWIGAEASASATAYDSSVALFIGNMSDFRIYSTPLSAADVKELYETSMIIDSDGNILPRVLAS